MSKMTKSQLMTTLAEKTGLAKKDVVTLLEALTELAYNETKSSG